jgi:hypothetical protein
MSYKCLRLEMHCMVRMDVVDSSSGRSDFSPCKGACRKELYKSNFYICSNSQATLQALEASRIMLKLVWECQQAICALSSSNKVTLLCVHGYTGILGNDADVLARKGPGS